MAKPKITPVTSGYQYILAYGIAIAVFVFAIKSRIGYNTMYYAFCLALLWLILAESKWIVTSLQPILTQPNSTGNPNFIVSLFKPGPGGTQVGTAVVTGTPNSAVVTSTTPTYSSPTNVNTPGVITTF